MCIVGLLSAPKACGILHTSRIHFKIAIAFFTIHMPWDVFKLKFDFRFTLAIL